MCFVYYNKKKEILLIYYFILDVIKVELFEGQRGGINVGKMDFFEESIWIDDYLRFFQLWVFMI